MVRIATLKVFQNSDTAQLRLDLKNAGLKATVRKGSGDRSVLQAAETIRAEETCVECHDVPVGTALGVLVVELDMAPLSHDVRRRASRNLWLLVLGSVLLLAILIFVVRRVVVGRLVSLSDAVSALRSGRRIQECYSGDGNCRSCNRVVNGAVRPERQN